MATQLIELRPSSITVDVPPSEVPDDQYTYGFNVAFREGFALKSLGWKRIFPAPDSPPQYLVNVYDGINNYWVAGSEDGIYVTDTVDWFDITPIDFVAAGSNEWSHALLNGVLVMNNGAFSPCEWSGNTGSIMTTIPDWPDDTVCSSMRAHRNHLFALGINGPAGNFPNRATWSDAAVPGTIPEEWIPTAQNDAGFADLASTASPIVDGMTLRGSFIVYKQSACYTFNYVGGTFVYNNRKLFGTTGLLARNCVQEYEGSHYLISDGDIFRHDGQNLVSLVDKRVKRFVFDQISSVARFTCFVAMDRPNNEILFCLPGATALVPSVALVYDTRRDKIGVRDIGTANHIARGIVVEANASNSWDADPESWNSDITVWDQTDFSAVDDGMLIANADADWVYHLDGSVDQDGEVVNFSASKSYMDHGLPSTVKMVKRIWPRMTAGIDGRLVVRVGASMSPDEAVTWADEVIYNPNTDRYVDTIVSGRFLSYYFSTPNGEQIQLNGWDVELETMGRY